VTGVQTCALPIFLLLLHKGSDIASELLFQPATKWPDRTPHDVVNNMVWRVIATCCSAFALVRLEIHLPGRQGLPDFPLKVAALA
ncbi:MAG TPA: hypothetical protein VLE22_16520, partial [Bryobacteraceae bacterium]|nr:hypothetical protein [Bryobacteraceae bacterium]